MPPSPNKSIFSQLDAAPSGDDRGARVCHYQDEIERLARGSARGLHPVCFGVIGASLARSSADESVLLLTAITHASQSIQLALPSDIARHLAAEFVAMAPASFALPRTHRPRRGPRLAPERLEKFLRIQRALEADPSLTAKAVCEREGVRHDTFSKWKVRWTARAAEESAAKAPLLKPGGQIL